MITTTPKTSAVFCGILVGPHMFCRSGLLHSSHTSKDYDRTNNATKKDQSTNTESIFELVLNKLSGFAPPLQSGSLKSELQHPSIPYHPPHPTNNQVSLTLDSGNPNMLGQAIRRQLVAHV
jgi:hypothetical protein